MKLTEDTYHLICEILEREANNIEDTDEYRKEIEIALQELDAIGTY